MRRTLRVATAGLVGIALFGTAARADDLTESLREGNPEIQSVGPLAFGPEGVLFVGDAKAGAVFALATGEAPADGDCEAIRVEDLGRKLADVLGTRPDQVAINDVAASPSGRVYLSVTRGQGPEASPAILRVDAAGTIDELGLEKIKFSRVDLPNPPDPNAQERGQSLRAEAITDLGYAGGRLFVAGLSNEEFSSRLLAIPVPFQDLSDGSSIEIYHGAHGRFETRSPIRTFLTCEIGGDPHLLAAYTCTPLVKIPLAELKPGTHVKGTTIAELGNRNRPLDMIAYEKQGRPYFLLANNSRGVMKIDASTAESIEPVVSRVADTKGLPYETIEGLTGVVQLDKLDEGRALILRQDEGGALSLETIDLP